MKRVRVNPPVVEMTLIYILPTALFCLCNGGIPLLLFWIPFALLTLGAHAQEGYDTILVCVCLLPL